MGATKCFTHDEVDAGTGHEYAIVVYLPIMGSCGTLLPAVRYLPSQKNSGVELLKRIGPQRQPTQSLILILVSFGQSVLHLDPNCVHKLAVYLTPTGNKAGSCRRQANQS